MLGLRSQNTRNRQALLNRFLNGRPSNIQRVSIRSMLSLLSTTLASLIPPQFLEVPFLKKPGKAATPLFHELRSSTQALPSTPPQGGESSSSALAPPPVGSTVRRRCRETGSLKKASSTCSVTWGTIQEPKVCRWPALNTQGRSFQARPPARPSAHAPRAPNAPPAAREPAAHAPAASPPSGLLTPRALSRQSSRPRYAPPPRAGTNRYSNSSSSYLSE